MRTISATKPLHTTRGALHRQMLLSAAALAIALAGNAHAVAFLNAIGGDGGGQFQERCANNDMLIGFELRAGDDVDAIRPLCVTAYGPRRVSAAAFTSGSGLITNSADASAPWGFSQTLESGWHGGIGGGLTHIVCPSDQPIVTGMFVAAEGVDTVIVNNIHLFCAQASATRADSEHPAAIFDAPAYRASSAVFGIGSGGRQPYRDNNTQRCPGGTVAVGVHGRSGKWLDAIGLICAEPHVDASKAPVGSLGKIIPATSSPQGAPMSICERARDARSRNSPAAANLEAHCLASKTTVSSLGKIATTPTTLAPSMSICERARNARARNSPAAPNLEAQCNAAESRATGPQSLPILAPSAASEAIIDGVQAQAPTQVANSRRRSDSYPVNGSSTTTLSRHHGTQALPRREAEAAIDDEQQQNFDEQQRQAERNDARGTFLVDREAIRHDPYQRSGLDGRQIDRGAIARERPQPPDSIHVEVRYPTAYGYRDAQSQGAFGGGGPDSCYAFDIEVIADTRDPEVHGLIGIEYGAKPMREWRGMYVCEYLISNLPHEELIGVRVAMNGDRTSASDAWLDGSQPRPGRRQHRAILEDEQSVVLTAARPRASLSFEMIYAGPP